MGMDLYMIPVKPEEVGDRKTDTAVVIERINTAHTCWTWRRDRELFGFMKELYHRKGGGGRDFNTPDNVVVDEDDLDQLVLRLAREGENDMPHVEEEVRTMRAELRDGYKLVFIPSY